MLLQQILFTHVASSFFNAVVSLAVILIILNVFRIKNPSTRFMFLLLPLIKPALALFDNTAATRKIVPGGKPVLVGVKMYDPLNMIKSPYNEAQIGHNDTVVVVAISVAMLVIFAVLMMRWMQMFLFFRSLKKGEKLSRSKYGHVYELLDEIASKFNINSPMLALTEQNNLVPFTVGYRSPVIVLSRDLIRDFNQEQLKVMLAHEMAHIKRKDHLLSWVAVILRDILFFNPPVHYVYRMLEEEKERACDRQAIEKTGASSMLVSSTILDLAVFYKRSLTNQKQAFILFSKGFLQKESLIERRITSLPKSIKKKRFLPLATSIKLFVFIIILYVQPYMIIKH